MTVRADHVAGTAFVVFGILVLALSGDLPMGQLSMPGSGFLPTLVAILMIILGGTLFLRAAESRPFSEIDWSDAKHAIPVAIIAAGAILAYERLGFIITMALMMLALIVGIERRNLVRAASYSVAVVALTFGVFRFLLKTPLPDGLLGY